MPLRTDLPYSGTSPLAGWRKHTPLNSPNTKPGGPRGLTKASTTPLAHRAGLRSIGGQVCMGPKQIPRSGPACGRRAQALVVSDSLPPYGLQPARLLCPWDSPGKNIGVCCHALLQGIFPTQGSNPCLLLCRQILCHQGNPCMISTVSLKLG